MIISKKHKFLFIKTHKTAGISLEIALSRHCGDEDIITPMGGSDENLRFQMSGRGSQNYRMRLSQLGPIGMMRALRHRYRPRLWNHASYSDALNFCSFEGFPEDYFIFAVERHPFEKVRSLYFHEKSKGFRGDFESFCVTDRLQRVSDYSLYAGPDGQVAAQIYRYERLAPSLVDIASKIGIPPLEMARAKLGMRTKEVVRIGKRESKIICEVFAREFDLFGYSRDLNEIKY